MPGEPRLEEQAISEVVKQGLLSQVDNAENVEVDIKTDLLKMVQGKLDSVSVTGEGVFIQEDIRVEQLEIQTDQVSINPLSAIFGKIELNQPTNTTAHVVLTEFDLNQALNSSFVRSKNFSFELNVEGQPVKVEMLFPLELRLPSDEKIHIGGNLKLHKPSETQTVPFAAVASVRTTAHPVLLESFYCAPGQGQPIELLIALLQKLQALVNQPYFEIEKTSFRVQSMDVKKETLALDVELHSR